MLNITDCSFVSSCDSVVLPVTLWALDLLLFNNLFAAVGFPFFHAPDSLFHLVSKHLRDLARKRIQDLALGGCRG